ncbi:Protein Wnt-2 [Gryllus bimaculatus]|nr:Protein Wnt-2 [Gryllus bimaculatus]
MRICFPPASSMGCLLQAVEASLERVCKCHGVSGACSVQTCWRALPASLAAGAGARLLRAFEAAAGAVRGRRVGATGRLLLAPPRGQRELAFVAASPDYCEPDRRAGSLGTHGRNSWATKRKRHKMDLRLGNIFLANESRPTSKHDSEESCKNLLRELRGTHFFVLWYLYVFPFMLCVMWVKRKSEWYDDMNTTI